MADEAGMTGRPTAGDSDDVTCARYVLGDFTTAPRRVPDDERPPGLLAGRYEVGRLVGSGGTARVYRAYDLRLDREVAVKIYDRDALPVDQRRRLRETTIQAGISHPGVVALLDSGSENGRTYLVMQLVEGENLAERLLSGPMPVAEVAALADGLAEALAHVHARRVVHRDLKPANVFLSAGGPLIGDFGIAHALDTTHITGTGVVPGTAAYLAPEQVSGEPAGPPADVYALGLILLECLTGEREYAGTMVEAAMARLSRPPRIPADVPDSLAHALRRMTRREPADRPTAAEVRRLLHAPAPVTALVRRPLWRRRLEAVERLPGGPEPHAAPAEDSAPPKTATLAAPRPPRGPPAAGWPSPGRSPWSPSARWPPPCSPERTPGPPRPPSHRRRRPRRRPPSRRRSPTAAPPTRSRRRSPRRRSNPPPSPRRPHPPRPRLPPSRARPARAKPGARARGPAGTTTPERDVRQADPGRTALVPKSIRNNGERHFPNSDSKQ
ncbi:serine/threonine-protein kinase [Amycolatopsis lexingtonensis]|uniref:serine/threonine-protein kinase n=1 Tax=Amycolatopsis lexingtonensis TaxID=218822 RepID=UPI003F70941A